MSDGPHRLLSSPHALSGLTVVGQMRDVLLALVPGVVVMVLLQGAGVLVNIALAVAAALAAEVAGLRLRGLPPRAGLADGSALVTAVLLALALPPICPWYLPLAAAVFAVLVAKQAFGGLGGNVFNPAMAGYAFAALSFPAAMSQWLPPDGVSGATPLAAIATELRLNRTLSEIFSPGPAGVLGARHQDLVNLAFLAGGIGLLFRRVISWHVPVAFLGGMFVVAGLFAVADSDRHLSPVFHLFSGATMIGAFFIATDPVSSPVTLRGRLLFGAGCGVLAWFVRAFGSFPDGVAFAVLTMNTAVPLIDRMTRPRTLGEHR